MAQPTRVRIEVEGRVQGVFFRESTRREAQRLGVSGWVRNRPDGSVEAVFEGEPSMVEAAVEWARRGPERAVVTALRRVDEEPQGADGFSVR